MLRQKRLGYFNIAFMAVTLFITLFLINNYKGVNVIYFGLVFIAINLFKDLILHKLGFRFNRTGIKPLLVTHIFIIIAFFIYIYSLFRIYGIMMSF